MHCWFQRDPDFCALEFSGKEGHFQGIARESCDLGKNLDLDSIIFSAVWSEGISLAKENHHPCNFYALIFVHMDFPFFPFLRGLTPSGPF